MAPKVAFIMANYGHDPTETAVPYHEFKEAGYEIDFVTEMGNKPVCDKKMLEGWTQRLLGADKAAISLYNEMQAELDSPDLSPRVLSWSAPNFTLIDYDLLFFPGGHEKGVVQVINSPIVHKLVAQYFPQSKKPSKKSCAAICHGVMVLAESSVTADGDTSEQQGDKGKKSVLHDATTTALPGFFEQSIFWGTRAFLGDYYKTYGAGSESVEQSVTKRLSSPKQFHSSLGTKPFIRRDETYNYISARFPPDAQLLAKATIEMVNNVLES